MDLKIIIVIIIVIILLVACYFITHNKTIQNGGGFWMIKNNITLNMLENYFPKNIKLNYEEGFVQNDEQYKFTYDDWKEAYGDPIGKLIDMYGSSITLNELLFVYHCKCDTNNIKYSSIISENIPIIMKYYPFWEASCKMLIAVPYSYVLTAKYKAFIYNPKSYNELTLI